MSRIDEIKKLMGLLNHKFSEFEKDARFHEGYKDEVQCTKKSKTEFIDALVDLGGFMLLKPGSNAIDLGPVTFYKRVGIDDIDAEFIGTNLSVDSIIEERCSN